MFAFADDKGTLGNIAPGKHTTPFMFAFADDKGTLLRVRVNVKVRVRV